MVDIWQEPEIYSRIIHEKENGLEQVRLTINTFRDIEYIHLRKYYLDFEEEWKPSKEGIAMPLDLTNSYELFAALVENLISCRKQGDDTQTFWKTYNRSL